MARQLENKVAIITGGASGIGLASVEAFVAQGAKVVIADIQDAVGDEIVSRLGSAVAYKHTDISTDGDIEAVVAFAVEKFGKLDIMFNNAGAQGPADPIIDMAADHFDKSMALLLRSVVLGHKYAARQFRKQGTAGSIISTASAAAHQGGWSVAGYTIAKHGVVGIIHQAAAELAGFGIRSNAISPGIIMTPIVPRSFGIADEQGAEFIDYLGKRVAQDQPIGRAGRSEDVAAVAVFLAGDAAGFVTGAVIPVDGGALAVTTNPFAANAAKAAKDFKAGKPV